MENSRFKIQDLSFQKSSRHNNVPATLATDLQAGAKPALLQPQRGEKHRAVLH